MLKEYNNYYLSKIGFNVTDKNLKRYIQKRDISSQKYIKLNQYIEKNI